MHLVRLVGALMEIYLGDRSVGGFVPLRCGRIRVLLFGMSENREHEIAFWVWFCLGDFFLFFLSFMAWKQITES